MNPFTTSIINNWKDLAMCRLQPATPGFNPLPDDKILDWSKFKALSDDKLNVTKMIILVFDRVENIVGKEKLLVQAISPFPTMFSKGFFPRGVKRCHCGVMS